MRRRGFLAAVAAVVVLRKLPRRENAGTHEETWEIRTASHPSTVSLTMPVYDSIEAAVRDFGEQQVLKHFNRSMVIEGQMLARRYMRGDGTLK